MTASTDQAISAPERSRVRRWPWVAGAAAATVAAVLIATDPFAGSTAPGTSGNTAATTTGAVTSGPLSAQVQENGTLGYAASYTITSQAAGVYTALPRPGQVITRGHSLYQVNDAPVVLLYGPMPAYRSLSSGDSGPDVTELNNDLAALGYGGSKGSDQFTSATASAVQHLQSHLGLPRSGSLSLGSVVFEPGPVRITSVAANSGSQANSGAAVLTATSTTRQVTVSLDAAQQSEVKPGDKVTITLPDNTSTPGTVSSVGSVATSAGSPSSSSAAAGNGTAPASTVQVEIAPGHPAATGSLDQAPVQVTITSQTVKNALAVPVTALLATTGGGYAVEVVPGHHLVPVTLGIFDDAAGLVQVTGHLHPGERVVEALT